MTMAITLECPRCMHEQRIEDDKIGKDVPCKICHHLIKTRTGGEKPKAKLAAEKDAQPEAVKPGSPSVPTDKKTTTISANEPAKPSKKRSDQEDDDEKRPVPRKRRANQRGSSAGIAMVLISGGVCLLLALLCGGGGFGAYFLFRSDAKPDDKIAQNDKPEFGPQPGPEPGPRPGPDPFAPLDANDPNHIDRVLDELKGADQQRGPALAWLNHANPNHARRDEVARLLDGMVEEQMKSPFGNDNFFNPYFKWATKDSVPSLLRLVDHSSGAHWYNRYRHEAMKLLAKFKDARGAEPVAKRLASPFERNNVTDILIEMGPIAESAVLKYFNHPDHNIRSSARKILQAYNTRNEVLFAICLADLDGTDANRRVGALQWLAKCQVDDRRKSEVAKSLNKLLDQPDCLRNGDLVATLENWGTTENVPKLTQILDQSRFGNPAAIRILGKMRDPDGIKAIARSIANPLNHGEAKRVLKEVGPLAEPAVIDVLTATNEIRTRLECIRLLGEIGTPKVSGMALHQLAQRSPQDRFLLQNIQQAQTAINARGK
jgi:HEAT repeat protein/ribosomal protein S27E